MIGYTGGTFDLFHIGHLRLLQTAKKYCDKLIVGVSSDELASSYKPSPVIPYDQRREIVKGIKGVDAVVLQDTLDKVKMWEKLKFDVLLVGDDWQGKEEWDTYEKTLSIYGVKTIYLPHGKGISTTAIKERLKND